MLYWAIGDLIFKSSLEEDGDTSSHHHAYVEEKSRLREKIIVDHLWNLYCIWKVFFAMLLNKNPTATFSASALSETRYKERRKSQSLEQFNFWWTLVNNASSAICCPNLTLNLKSQIFVSIKCLARLLSNTKIKTKNKLYLPFLFPLGSFTKPGRSFSKGSSSS